ncbi:MAG: hypothetical protein HYX68_17925 [Planctomycetes bacterium]|nr:hypothetical protein [Planctomycetota bacterium]
MSRRWWLVGLLGLVCPGASQDGQAWQRPAVKVNTRFEFRVNVKVGPEFARPTAPWYAYFPADAHRMPPMQASPFPPWPAQFPPQGPPADFPKQGQTGSRNTNRPSGPMLTQYWPTYYSNGGNLQPVGYVPTRAPSYWYQGR